MRKQVVNGPSRRPLKLQTEQSVKPMQKDTNVKCFMIFTVLDIARSDTN